MTRNEMEEFLSALHDLIHPHLRKSEPLRKLVGLLAAWLQTETEDAEAHSSAESEAAPAKSTSDLAPTPSSTIPDLPAKRADTITHVVSLKLGTESVAFPVSSTADELVKARSVLREQADKSTHSEEYEDYEERGQDLDLVIRRTRLKAEACRVLIDRRMATGDPTAELPLVDRIDALIAEARSIPDCFLWVLWREKEPPKDSVLRITAECYDAVAEAAALIVEIDGFRQPVDRDHLENAFLLLAEADSALRVALEETWLSSPDQDQYDAHLWLRRESKLRTIYLHRFMRIDDPGNPEDAPDIRNRISLLQKAVRDRADQRKAMDSALKKIQYHKHLLSKTDQIDPEDHDAGTILKTIDSLVELGMPPSDRRFREVLDDRTCSCLLAAFDDLSPGALAVLEQVQEWRNRAPAEVVITKNESSDTDAAWSEAVGKVRELLQGRSVVVVGGESRNEAIERIKSAFDLTEVVWMALPEHGSPQPLRAPIIRSEVALVVVLVKLAGHDHVESAVRYAREAEKPCVLLRAGYNPEQIANQILIQAEDRLMLSKANA